MLSITQNLRLVAIWCLCCLFASSPTLADESPDEIALQPGYGYLLIRVVGKQGERVGRLEMTNPDTGYVIKTYSRMYKSAGLYAWMCLVAVPEGRYFVSEYTPRVGDHFGGVWWNLEPIRLEAPSSTSNTFEIAPGVINYVGDWTMQSQWRRQKLEMEPDVNFDMKTLERLIDRYPEYANRYDIYLAMMGKKAISLEEFRKIVEEHSNATIE